MFRSDCVTMFNDLRNTEAVINILDIAGIFKFFEARARCINVY